MTEKLKSCSKSVAGSDNFQKLSELSASFPADKYTDMLAESNVQLGMELLFKKHDKSRDYQDYFNTAFTATITGRQIGEAIRKAPLLLLLILMIFAVGGCSSAESVLRPDDVLLSARVAPFTSVPMYRSYFGVDQPLPEKEAEKIMRNFIRVDMYWDLRLEKKWDNQGSTKFYYSPYLIVIPPKEEVVYAGGHRGVNLHTVGAALPHEVLENVLKDNKDYNWAKMSEERFGYVLHARSFEQGSTSLAFLKNINSDITPTFKIYFIYYDPLAKQGWVRPIKAL
ncbi:hypothetical protein SY88_20750 [Clostridiales bacterium PH28_bin88]|nr:hypothetical protein SY88_20750 [Clostridiales bacterium PH28_bin88]